MRHQLVTCVLLSACTQAVKPDEPATPAVTAPDNGLRARDFYPLAVGNAWTYQVVNGGETQTRTVTITGKESGFYKDTGGGNLKHDARGLRDPDRYLLMEPLVEGQKWSAIASVQSTELYEILEAGRACVAPAGTFARCLRVRATNALDATRAVVNELTYAEGVGLVEIRSFRSTAGKLDPQFQVQLTSFKLAQ